MDFGSVSSGVSKIGIENYITELRFIVLTKVAGAILNTSDIVSAVNKGWAGKAAENFKTALSHESESLAESLNDLEKAFHSEMYNIRDQFADFDNRLFEE